jgi:DNA primase
MYKRESLETLRAIIDPKDVLLSLGGVSPRDLFDNGDELRCPCPIHGGDNRTAFAWKRNINKWQCFTKNCGENTSRDIFAFISLKLQIPFHKAAELLAERYHFTLEKGTLGDMEAYKSSDLAKTSSYVKEFNTRSKYVVNNLPALKDLPGYDPDNLDTMIKYLNSRGYMYDDISIFNFYPMIDSCGILRMGIPVYDDSNRIVGVNARLMNTVIDYPETVMKDGKELPVPKYKMTSFQKGSVLYNLNNAKAHALKDGLILTEGQLDVSRLHTYGIYNSVCTMGTSLTTQQVSLIYRCAFKLTFLLEEGEAARKGVAKSLKNLATGIKLYIAELPSGDADSNTKEVVTATLDEAIELTDKTKQKFIDYYSNGSN